MSVKANDQAKWLPEVAAGIETMTEEEMMQQAIKASLAGTALARNCSKLFVILYLWSFFLILGSGLGSNTNGRCPARE